MKVIARPIDTGKTEELLRLAAEDKAFVLTDRKAELQEKANAYGITVQVIDWSDLFTIPLDSEYNKVYIHRMDELVSEWLYTDYKLKVEGYSVRTE